MMNRKRNGTRARREDSPPCRQLWHPEVPGPLWDGSRVVDWKQIEAYCRVVAREFQPQKIILFGSYAADSATPDSDVDLVVVMPFHGNATDQVVNIRGRAEAPFPMDLLVWKPDRIRRRDSFTQAVLKEGRVLYESRRAGVRASVVAKKRATTVERRDAGKWKCEGQKDGKAN